jgi:CxxC motif-containing protein
MNKIFLFWIICISTLISGCATVTTERTEIVLNRCPTLKRYTQEQLMKAAQEIKNIPTDSEISVMITDYSKIRDACRLVEKKLKKNN